MIILHIDDDEDDREMLDRALHQIAPSVQVLAAPNGMAGLDCLKQAKAIGKLPCLVVLDLNMPVLDGRKTLDLIQHDTALANIPVVIFTSGENPHDRMFFLSKACDYIGKPMNSAGLLVIARQLYNYCR